MSLALPQPVLPWSGAQEEDRRFRRILLTVLVTASVLSAILRQLPLPWVEPELPADDPAVVLRIIAQPITLSAPPPATVRPAASEPSPAGVPEPQASAERPQTSLPTAEIDQPPVTPEPTTRAVEPPQAAQQTLPQQAAPARQGQAPATQRRQQVDRVAAAREKAAKSGVLAMRDSLAALRTFTPATPAAGPAAGPAVNDRPATAGKPSVLNEGVASGSGGIGGAVPGPREVFGRQGLQDRPGGAGGLAALRGSSAGGGAGTGPSLRGKTRSEEEIQEVLDRHKSAIYTLYNRELRDDPSLQGKVVVSITIAPSGRVTGCRIEYSELQSERLEENLIRLIKGVDFGAKADVPPVTTKVPIEFFPV